jgi:hypothetical protein
MPTADATLLPPVPLETPPSGLPALGANPSMRRLDEVGVEAVLGAMIEQKRRSSRPAPSELAELASEDEYVSCSGSPADPDVFMKVR